MSAIYLKVDDKKYIPEQKHKDDAGFDLKSRGTHTIQPGETCKVPTGVRMAIPWRCGGFIFPRSGLATTKGLRLANCVGVVDNNYRGEIGVPLYNDSREAQTVKDGDRIAQLIILRVEFPEIRIVETLSKIERGEGGFGSTGV
jgi:dUTP pyrophosphatase